MGCFGSKQAAKKKKEEDHQDNSSEPKNEDQDKVTKIKKVPKADSNEASVVQPVDGLKKPASAKSNGKSNGMRPKSKIGPLGKLKIVSSFLL